jgi:hypothetical protein
MIDFSLRWVYNEKTGGSHLAMDGSEYNSRELRGLVDRTGLSHDELAVQVGVKRLTITRAVNGKNASWELIRSIVQTANEVLHDPEPFDPRSLLYPKPIEQKNLALSALET